MRHSLTKYLFLALIHVIGVLAIFIGFSAVFLSKELSVLIYNLMGDVQIRSQIIEPLVILLGLSALLWAGVVFVVYALKQPTRQLRRTQGAILTETLIVLPIFLLFTGGLAQMGMNSMAGLLTTVGAFEAGRTLAVWGPEVGKERIDGSITEEVAREQARIAVAAIVTPVARDSILDITCSSSDAFTKYADGMGAALSPILLTAAATPAIAGAQTKIWDFSSAFGNKSFLLRGNTKLKSAYCSVSIDVDFATIPTSGQQGEVFTVEVAYNHRPVFAYVQKIFNNSEIKRQYTMRSHLPPNDVLPEAH